MSTENLNEFEDHIKEFESGVFFNSEICPTCCINRSNSLSPSKTVYVQIEFESIDKKNYAFGQIRKSRIQFEE